ncbi:MAG: toll/interleukin-1 receptor domain-containing protein [Gordonia sp. (in: high G+C Gram-positive bacteria)]
MVNPRPPFPAYQGDDTYAFASYAHADAHLVFPLLTQLHEDGYRIWYDEGIEPTDEWAETISDRIARCTVFCLFVSKVSVARDGVANEIHQAHGAGRPFLAVYLEPTELPRAIDHVTGTRQAITDHTLPRDALLVKIRRGFEKCDLAAGPSPATVSGPPPAPPRVRGLMPARPRIQAPPPVTARFADRVPESEALIAAVRRQRRRLADEEEIRPEEFPTVLVFHGGSGLGKTGLSRRLELWADGRLAGPHDWGEWPLPPIVGVRWDFHESEGNIDLVGLLVSLRTALAETRQTWTAFDVGLAAYLEKVRTGGQEGLGLTGDAAEGVRRSFQIVAAQLRLGPPSELTAGDVRRIVAAVSAASDRGPLAHHDQLPRVLDGVRRISAGNQAPDVVADLLYLLTQEIYFIEPAERPALVFFLDPFEKIQRQRTRQSEATIAEFVTCLPYGLFVITGRDHLGWADVTRTDLPIAGPRAWPGLVGASSPEPRQHLLGRLSDVDTRHLYTSRCDAEDWRMSGALIDALVDRSAGVPLHINAILALAQNLENDSPGREFTSSDLDTELPEVVTRLIATLDADEAEAFRAACVLPGFDVELAAAVGQVPRGAVQRAILYSLVEEDSSATYPFRVHDEIRQLVQRDRTTRRCWSGGDWRIAARRGMVEALARVGAGLHRDSDHDQIAGLELAIRLGHEWDIYEPGLATLIQNGPTIAALAPRIPSAGLRQTSDADDVIRWIQAIALPFAESAAALGRIRPRNSEIARLVARWRLIRLRLLSHQAQSIAAAEALGREFPEHSADAHLQHAITLRLFRRFRDSLDVMERWRPDALSRARQVIDRFHGLPASDPATFRAYRDGKTSARLRLELDVRELVHRARHATVTMRETRMLMERTVDLQARTDTENCLMVQGYLSLARAADFAAVLAELDEHEAAAGVPTTYAAELRALRALRALATRDPADLDDAIDHLVVPQDRKAGWIPAEIWLAELGHPLPELPAQWLIPFPQVRDNWLRIADRIIRRAQTIGADANSDSDHPV